jgi:hypothetical protein
VQLLRVVTLCCDPGGSGEADVWFAGLVVRVESTGRPACLDFLGPLIETCDAIACLTKCRRRCRW